jgi:hypothetical protein
VSLHRTSTAHQSIRSSKHLTYHDEDHHVHVPPRRCRSHGHLCGCCSYHPTLGCVGAQDHEPHGQHDLAPWSRTLSEFCSLSRTHAYATPSSQHQNVTWDTSDAPASISNKFSVVLDGSTCLSFTRCAERSQAVPRDTDLRLRPARRVRHRRRRLGHPRRHVPAHA